MVNEVLVVVPARSGSKGIPKKNLRDLAGKPLLVHSIEHAQKTPEVSRIIVSTDGDDIAAVAMEHGAEVVRRPPNISGDKATSESALLHVLDTLRDDEGYEPDLVVFLQATSPLRQPDDIQNAIDTLRAQDADSLFSASRVEGFVWRDSGDEVTSLTYDYQQRQRRQELGGEDLLENGSIYVFKPWVLREFNNRLGGKIAVYRMHPLDSFQIDEPADLELLEQLFTIRAPQQPAPDLSRVRLLVLDFDGVMTDNRVLVDEDGKEAVWVNRSDGWGIARLREAGIKVAVLSTETNPVVAARCRKLGIPHTQGLHEKRDALLQLVAKTQVSLDEVAFVGNDVNDLSCLNLVGVPMAVADAVPEVKQATKHILTRAGGRGAVREVCDLILQQLPQLEGSNQDA